MARPPAAKVLLACAAALASASVASAGLFGSIIPSRSLEGALALLPPNTIAAIRVRDFLSVLSRAKSAGDGLQATAGEADDGGEFLEFHNVVSLWGRESGIDAEGEVAVAALLRGKSSTDPFAPFDGKAIEPPVLSILALLPASNFTFTLDYLTSPWGGSMRLQQPVAVDAVGRRSASLSHPLGGSYWVSEWSDKYVAMTLGPAAAPNPRDVVPGMVVDVCRYPQSCTGKYPTWVRATVLAAPEADGTVLLDLGSGGSTGKGQRHLTDVRLTYYNDALYPVLPVGMCARHTSDYHFYRVASVDEEGLYNLAFDQPMETTVVERKVPRSALLPRACSTPLAELGEALNGRPWASSIPLDISKPPTDILSVPSSILESTSSMSVAVMVNFRAASAIIDPLVATGRGAFPLLKLALSFSLPEGIIPAGLERAAGIVLDEIFESALTTYDDVEWVSVSADMSGRIFKARAQTVLKPGSHLAGMASRVPNTGEDLFSGLPADLPVIFAAGNTVSAELIKEWNANVFGPIVAALDDSTPLSRMLRTLLADILGWFTASLDGSRVIMIDNQHVGTDEEPAITPAIVIVFNGDGQQIKSDILHRDDALNNVIGLALGPDMPWSPMIGHAPKPSIAGGAAQPALGSASVSASGAVASSSSSSSSNTVPETGGTALLSYRIDNAGKRTIGGVEFDERFVHLSFMGMFNLKIDLKVGILPETGQCIAFGTAPDAIVEKVLASVRATAAAAAAAAASPGGSSRTVPEGYSSRPDVAHVLSHLPRKRSESGMVHLNALARWKCGAPAEGDVSGFVPKFGTKQPCAYLDAKLWPESPLAYALSSDERSFTLDVAMQMPSVGLANGRVNPFTPFAFPPGGFM
jgi:hypothetical protein